MPRPHFVHVMPSFGPGGAQIRTIDLFHHFGDKFRHTVVSLSSDTSAAPRIDPSLEVAFKICPKSTNPVTMLSRLGEIFRACRPDLILTYNWGAIDAMAAARMTGLAPIIHAEDGFGDEEAQQQYRRRVWARRCVLRLAHRVVSPSATLTRIMKDDWLLPSAKVMYIPNGIETDHFVPRATPLTGPEIVIGTVGHLRREKRQDVLIECCAELARTRPVRLLIAGDGPERPSLEDRARSLGISDRVQFLGYQADVRNVYHQLDIFAMTSSTEQMPYGVLEAMACGLPVVSTDVGDVKGMVSARNAEFIVPPGPRLQMAVGRLIDDATLRTALGEENRAECSKRFTQAGMFDAYASLYRGALGPNDALSSIQGSVEGRRSA